MLDYSPATITQVTQGSLRTADGESLPLLHTNVVARVDGPIASVVVTQTFKSSKSVPIEAIYSFPLPHEASVFRMDFTIGDRVVKGVIKEREAARRAYQAAKAEGRAATLLEEESPAVFTLSVANVAAGASIVVHLEYQEVIAYEDGRFIFVFPMVAPDLYRDAPAPAAADAVPPPRTLSPDRNADVSIEVHLPMNVSEVRGRSHTVHPEIGAKSTIVRLGNGAPIANRDFVLEWEIARGGVHPVLRLEPPATPEGKGTFLLTLAPSRADAKTELTMSSGEARPIRCGNCGAGIDDARAIIEVAGFGQLVKCKHCGAMLAPATGPVIRASRSRDVIILFDRSASMRQSMDQARDMVMAVVDALHPGDAVCAITFDHDRAVFDGEPRWVAAGPEVAERIATFLDVPARGGSELTKALEASTMLPARENRTRTIVLVTDGAVGNTAKLLRRVPDLIGKSTRLHVLGVGAAVNRFFIESLARAGGGASTIVTPKDQPRILRDRFARKVVDGGPVLMDISLSWDGSPEEMHPRPLPDLYGSEPLHVVGRYSGTGPSKLVITARTPTGASFRQEVEMVRPEPKPPEPGVPRLERIWARSEVKKLMENGRSDLALMLALEHSLATPLTSLIAEDTEVSVKKVPIPKVRLRLENGYRAGKTWELKPGKTRIGRGEIADIELDHGNVSRMHLEITADISGYKVRDLSSTNGTYIDGRRIREDVLARSCRLNVGAAELSVEFIENETIEVLPTETVNVAEELEDEEEDRDEIQAARAAYDSDHDELRSAVRDMPMPPPRIARGGMPAPRPSRSSYEDDEVRSLARDSSPAMRPRPAAGMAPPPRAASYAGPGASAPTREPATGAAPPLPGPPPAMPRMPPPPAVQLMASAPSGPLPPPRSPAAMPPPAAPRAAPPPIPAGGVRPCAMPLGAMSPPPPLSPPRDLEHVAAARRSTSARPMSGDLDEVPLLDLLRLFETAKKSGKLVLVSSAGERGSVFVRKGRFGDASIEGRYISKEMAAREMLEWRGTFEFESETERVFAEHDLVTLDELRGGPRAPRQAAPIPQAPAILPSGPAYPEAELTFVKHRVKGELDLALLVDATQSMGPYIETVKRHMQSLLEAVAASPLCKSLRVAVVSYRDHPPEDESYTSRVDVAFTSSIADARAAVDRLAARGGGDSPEAVTDGLFDVVRLDWRPEAAKAVVWFGDAPPHGVGEYGDGFSGGCPCGNDWFAQAESCREMGIAIYALGCLPTIRQFKAAEQVYRTVARATHGMYLALHEAHLLVPLIAGAAETTLDNQRIDEHVLDLVNAHRDTVAATDDQERVRWILDGLTRRGIQRRSVSDDGTRAFRNIVIADIDASLSRLRAEARVGW